MRSELEPRTLADLPAPDETACRHLLAVLAPGGQSSASEVGPDAA